MRAETVNRGIVTPDLWMLLAIVGLVTIGLVANYSTSFAEGEFEFTHFYKQSLWASIGFGILITLVILPVRFIQITAYVLYAIGIIGLLAVLVAGHTGMGATRWIDIGGFRLQPSEFAKVTTLIGVSRFLSDFPREMGKVWVTGVAILLTVIPMGLILVEPDLGTSLVFPVMMFCLLAWSGVPGTHLLIIIAPVLAVITSWSETLHMIAAAILGLSLYLTGKRIVPVLIGCGIFLSVGQATPHLWGKLHPYQQKRLLTFINPEADPLGSAYQIIQSKIAVGSGGVTGKGFLHGTQTQLKFLPEGHTDFIFSAFGEEFGFAGTVTVVILFFILFWRGMQLSWRCHNQFYSLIVAGAVCLVTAQVMTNLFMTVGLLPVTGVPLPFVSYGGSSLINMLFLMGLVLSISIRWREY